MYWLTVHLLYKWEMWHDLNKKDPTGWWRPLFKKANKGHLFMTLTLGWMKPHPGDFHSDQPTLKAGPPPPQLNPMPASAFWAATQNPEQHWLLRVWVSWHLEDSSGMIVMEPDTILIFRLFENCNMIWSTHLERRNSRGWKYFPGSALKQIKVSLSKMEDVLKAECPWAKVLSTGVHSHFIGDLFQSV